MFQRLAEAEAASTRCRWRQVHLHEVGALDSIIDIVGIVFAIEWLAADRVVCSPLNVGGGTVQSAHGLFPVPAPATVSLLGDAPIYSGAVQKELVTPTGALIATTFASRFGPIPAMSIERVGTARASVTIRRRRMCSGSLSAVRSQMLRAPMPRKTSAERTIASP